MSDAEALLEQVPLFSKLDKSVLSTLAERARVLRFRKNTVLMSEGETGASLYIVRSGRVRIFISEEDGQELTLFIEGPGSYIGEISLLDDAPRTASAMTLEDTEVLSISKSAFQETVRERPDIALGLVKLVTQRLRKATDDIRTLALRNVYQRLALKLLELSEEQDGERVVIDKYSHQDLARMIGASREMVGKIMAQLVQGQYIEQRDGRWYLLRHLPHDW